MSETILEQIVRHKRGEIALLPDMADVPPCTQNFERIFITPRPGLIAEIKAASPSEGDIVTEFDPVAIARSYIAGGATALSILTDARFFKGSFDILRTIRQMTDLPLLCKDFILSDRQIRHARQHGADMCLLIVKILTPAQLQALKQTIEHLGMVAIIEIQNETELEIALSVRPAILLINNRNLESFKVNLDTSGILIKNIPEQIRVIAASGIKTPSDLESFSPRVDGFLIGTALMRAPDKIDFLRRCRAIKN
jgi:indole-3-glycerol phosphate synthase/phosphoribosylanthranilate isomerase